MTDPMVAAVATAHRHEDALEAILAERDLTRDDCREAEAARAIVHGTRPTTMQGVVAALSYLQRVEVLPDHLRTALSSIIDGARALA